MPVALDIEISSTSDNLNKNLETAVWKNIQFITSEWLEEDCSSILP